MKIQQTNLLLTASLLLASLNLLRAAEPAKLPAKPNIIIILADDLGPGDISCAGATKIKTPNIDRLAAGGVRFTQGYAPSATCTPSRYSLLTGEYAWRQKAKSSSHMYEMVRLGDGKYLFAGSLSWRIFLPNFMLKQGAIEIWSAAAFLKLCVRAGLVK